jgi:RNase adaptor protein for sRNA GlmZ degradation
MFNLLNNPKYMGIGFIVLVVIIGVAMTFYVKNCVKTEIDEIRTINKKKKIVLMKKQQEMMAKRMEEERKYMQMMEEKKRQEAIANATNKEKNMREENEEDMESYIDPVELHDGQNNMQMNNIQSYNDE